MFFKLQSNNLEDYLKCTDIIDFSNPEISCIASEMKEKSYTNVELIVRIFEFVRDEIKHSIDINGNIVTCKASEVLENGEGICYAKSNLLAAIFRSVGIPTGFCYQKLLFDEDDINSKFVIHSLNAVYIKEINKWVRLDARGNNNNINSEFYINKEQLPFTVRPELGEIDYDIIFIEPDEYVTQALINNQTIEQLLINLPNELCSVQ